jgi:hypothetical protein
MVSNPQALKHFHLLTDKLKTSINLLLVCTSVFIFIYISIFDLRRVFCDTGIWTQGLLLAMQKFYHFSDESIVFSVFVIFLDRVLCVWLDLASDHGPPSYDLWLSWSWDYKYMPPLTDLFVEIGALLTICSGSRWGNFPNLYHLSGMITSMKH